VERCGAAVWSAQGSSARARVREAAVRCG